MSLYVIQYPEGDLHKARCALTEVAFYPVFTSLRAARRYAKERLGLRPSAFSVKRLCAGDL